MNIIPSHRHLFVWQSVSPLLKLSIMTLMGAALCSGLLTLRIESPDNIPLLVYTAILIFVAGCLAIKLFWIPLLGTLTSGFGLVAMALQPDVVYHMTHPREGDFTFFVLDTLLLACLLMTFIATLGGALQHVRTGKQEMHRAPTWLTPMISGIIGAVIGVLLLASIVQPTMMSAASQGANGEPSVHMGPGNFLTTTVTVPKGSKLLLVDDGPFLHILANGFWQGNQAKGLQEPGVPAVNQMHVNGGRVEIGPFTTAGTYHIYCSIHPEMNLTAIVS